MEKPNETNDAASDPGKPSPGKGAAKPAPAKPLAGLAEDRSAEAARRNAENQAGEIGGPDGPEPTRYGDWEIGGRCSDF